MLRNDSGESVHLEYQPSYARQYGNQDAYIANAGGKGTKTHGHTKQVSSKNKDTTCMPTWGIFVLARLTGRTICAHSWRALTMCAGIAGCANAVGLGGAGRERSG